MGEGNQSGSLGARLLIILYGFALVVIGAYPIQREYGSVFEFVRQKSSSFLGDVELPSWSWTRPEYKTVTQPVHSRGKNKKINKKKDLDKLTRSDRAELNDLMNNLNP